MPITRPPLTPEEIQAKLRLAEEQKRFYAGVPLTRRELVPVILAIRNIQQQLGIIPLLRLKLAQPPDQGDDDFTG